MGFDHLHPKCVVLLVFDPTIQQSKVETACYIQPHICYILQSGTQTFMISNIILFHVKILKHHSLFHF